MPGDLELSAVQKEMFAHLEASFKHSIIVNRIFKKVVLHELFKTRQNIPEYDLYFTI
jgi:hypothetical protein